MEGSVMQILSSNFHLFLHITKFTAVTYLQFIGIENIKPLNHFKYALAV